MFNVLPAFPRTLAQLVDGELSGTAYTILIVARWPRSCS